MSGNKPEPSTELLDWVIGLRRWFHQHPEPSFEEKNTQAKIVETLSALGIEFRRAGGTGVIGTIRGQRPGPTVALRSDMDALRIREAETGLNREYRSQNDGVMHACGHDGHMAMLLGAARWLQEQRAELAGNVRLIFQPAEEVPPGGALPMIADGCLDGVDVILGMHVFGTLPSGRLGFRPGPFMAASRTFILTIHGKPGHHMCPQDNIDPIQMAARFIGTVEANIRQAVPPLANYVFGFGEVHAGMQHNQTPSEARVVGTFRAFDPAISERIAATMRRTMDGLIEQFRKPGLEGVPSYKLEADPAYPPLVNEPAVTARAAMVLKERFADVDDRMEPNLGAEDFACYLERVPGVFIFLGCANPGRGITAINHSDKFDIDEPALGTGVRALLALTLDFLQTPELYAAR